MLSRRPHRPGMRPGEIDSALKAGFDRYLAASPKLDVRTRADVDEKAAVLKKEEEDRKKRKAEEEERRRRRARGGRGRGD